MCGVARSCINNRVLHAGGVCAGTFVTDIVFQPVSDGSKLFINTGALSAKPGVTGVDQLNVPTAINNYLAPSLTTSSGSSSALIGGVVGGAVLVTLMLLAWKLKSSSSKRRSVLPSANLKEDFDVRLFFVFSWLLFMMRAAFDMMRAAFDMTQQLRVWQGLCSSSLVIAHNDNNQTTVGVIKPQIEASPYFNEASSADPITLTSNPEPVCAPFSFDFKCYEIK